MIFAGYPASKYTINMVSVLLKNCSSTWELLVARMFCMPEKYPRMTLDNDTNKMDGANAFSVYFAPGIFMITSATNPAPMYKSMLREMPMVKNRPRATLKIRFALFTSPMEIFSLTNFEMALGIPTEEIAKSKV